MNVLKIKKLKENAIIPKRATEGSAGMDLYACIDSSVVINPGPCNYSYRYCNSVT